MKLLVGSKDLYNSITNSKDKERYLKKYFSGSRNFQNMPIIEVSLYDAKTATQNQTFWLDMSKVARLMYTDKETVYYWLRKHPGLKDIWMEESRYGKDGKKSYRFVTLSGLSKEKVMELIPRYRDILQEIVNKEYNEYIVINWSSIDNIDKKDFEFSDQNKQCKS